MIFFFNDTATTEIYTLSLHDALPIYPHVVPDADVALVDALLADRTLDFDHAVVEVDEHHAVGHDALAADRDVLEARDRRSEEHTSELQLRQYLVCRLLLEKKN